MKSTHTSWKWAAGALIALSLAGCSKGGDEAGAPKRPECIAPAKPGGGFDLTCKLAQSGLKDTDLLKAPMRVTYMPGGVGAVAYNKIVANDSANNDAIVAFSTGSLLNLAQGKFGQYTEKDVRWLAAVGTDYGMVAVNAESPYKTLADLVAALKADWTNADPLITAELERWIDAGSEAGAAFERPPARGCRAAGGADFNSGRTPACTRI